MAEKECRYCRKKASSNHSCPVAGRFVYYDNDGDFLTSFVVGSLTENPVIGTLIGGNPLGAIMGATMSEDDKHLNDHSDSGQHDSGHDTSSDSGSSDSGGSDSGGGCDGGGGGGD